MAEDDKLERGCQVIINRYTNKPLSELSIKNLELLNYCKAMESVYQDRPSGAVKEELLPPPAKEYTESSAELQRRREENRKRFEPSK